MKFAFMPRLVRRTASCFRTTSLLAGSVAVLLAGCTHIAQNGVASDATQRGLRIGVTDEPDSLNPLFSHTIVADDVAALTLAPLFRYDETGRYIPELAERVPALDNGDISVDGRTVTLRLRKGLQWQDGSPLDARDLVFTWHAVMNPRNATKLRGGWQNIRRIDTPDLQTAVLHLAKPDATVLSLFSGGGDAAYPLLPRHLLGRAGDLNRAAWNAAPVGSGPWKLVRWDHGSGLIFAPNEHYWRGKPKLRDLRLVILPDANAMMTAFFAHEIDAVMNVPADRRHDVEKTAGVTAVRHDVASYLHLDLNCRDPLLADPRVRTAIIEAVNWSAVLAHVYRGEGRPALSDIFPTSWAAPELPRYPHDPAAAAGILDAAGWHRGAQGRRMRGNQPLRLTIMSGNTNPLSPRAELLIARDLHAVGIDLVLKNAPANYLFAENGPLYTGKYQLAWMSDTRAPDPDNAANWTTGAMPPNGANTVFFSDPVVDRTANEARSITNRLRRKELYEQEELRLHLLAPSLTFAWQNEMIASWGPIRNLRPATYYSNFWNSWEWK